MIIKKISQQILKNNKLRFTFSTQLHDHYDVVISGAGPVGSAVACALQNDAYFKNQDKNKILLLDIFEPKNIEQVTQNPVPEHRVVSLSHSSIKFLNSIGAWQHMDEGRMGNVEHIQVWENAGQGYLQFNTENIQNSDYLSKIVENNHIVAGIMAEINKNGNVDTVYKNGIKAFSRKPEKGNKLEIELQNGEVVTTDLIIGSEGRGSKVKEISQINTLGWNYNQMGLVCTIKLSEQINNQSYQRYLEGGPLAILPLWGDYCSIVWSLPLDEYDYIVNLGDIEFLNELNQALNGKFRFATPNMDINQESFHYAPLVTKVCNKRLAFPIAQLQAQKYITDGVALVGDAAHSIHPQAGQGLNNGFNDAVGISNNILQNLRCGNNIGQEISLKQYETDAKSWNYATAMAMEGLQQTYGIQNKAFAFLRNIGVNMVNNFPALKNKMVETAAQNPYAPTQYLWEK